MEVTDIECKLQQHFADGKIQVTGDGYHFEAIIVSDSFAGKTLLARQREVYAIFKESIQTGELHALSIVAKTPEEWKESQIST